MSQYMSIEDFIEEYNYMCSDSEPLTVDIVNELYSEVVEMFQLNCGFVPNFELINGGKEIKLL